LAVAELMLAIGDLFGSMDGSAVGGATSAWAGFGKVLGGAVGSALTYAAKGLALLVEGIRFVVDGARELADRFGGRVVKTFQQGAASFISVGQKLQSFFSGVWNMLTRGMGIVGQTAGRVFARMGDVFSSVVRLAGSIGTAFSRVGETLTPLLAKIFGSQVSTGSSMWETFGTMLGGTVALAVDLVATGLGLLVNAVDMLVNGLTFVVSIFTGDIPAAAGAFRAIIDGMGQGLALLGDLFGVGDAIRAAWAGIMGFFDGINLFESGAKLLSTFADGIKSMAMAPVNAVSDALSGVREYLPFSDAHTGPLSTLTLSGSRMMSTLGEGVTSGAGALVASVSSALGDAGETLSSWWNTLSGQKPPELPTLTAPEMPVRSVPPVTAPDIKIPDVPSFAREERGNAHSVAQGVSGCGRTTTINISAINLPGVKEAAGFMTELQNTVASYEGEPA
ncbi:MAG: hypothetical protein RRY20_08865, partial [Bilophila sp.]